MTIPKAVGIAAVALVWSLVAEAVVDGWSQPLYIPLADLAVGWALVTSGLVGMIRRPGQVAGGRLVIAGFLWWVGNLAGSADPRIAILGFAFQGYHDVVLALLVLSFPARWPTRRVDAALVIGLAVVFAVNSVVRLAVRIPGELLGLDVIDQATAFSLIAVPDLLRGVALLVVAAGILGRLVASRGAFRRLVTPVLLAGAAWSGAAALNGVYVPLVVLGAIEPLPDDVFVPLAWSLNVIRIAVPIAIYVGIVRLRRERSAVADVIVEIAEAPDPSGLEAALRGALDDPSLRVLPWDAAAGAYVDRLGEPFDAAGPPDPGRAVTLLAHEGAPLAAVVHDAALVEEPGLLAAVVAAVRLTVQHERLEHEVARQLEDVRASRARIVEAGDLERRRIERDLHDGAQQRLVALALRSRRAAEGSADPSAAADLRSIEAEAIAILGDIRELAAGIHPAILTEVGLAGAIQTLADRSPIQVNIHLEIPSVLPTSTEATAYFVVAEALTNTAKHAGATAATVDAVVQEDRLVVRVRDDGSGGADAGGAGLRGLGDRVAAVGGSLSIDSPPGGGTALSVELPCVSS